MRFALIGLVLVCGLSWAGEVEISLRDAVTGLGLSGTVTLRALDAPVAPVAERIDALLAEQGQSFSLNIDRRASLVVEGPMVLRAEVPGYRTLHAVLRPAAENRGWTLMLDPLSPIPIPVAHDPERLLISGWVFDHDSAEPIAGADVQVQSAQKRTETDADGYFELEIAAPQVVDGRPEATTLSISAAGYPTREQTELFGPAGGVRMQIALGETWSQTESHRQLMTDPVWPDADPGERLDLTGRGTAGNQPPASITVGFADAGCTLSCCTGGCPHSCTFSLEEYTRRGLPKEWISSWAHDALAAGAVAYRSYGAWHVFNPPAHGAYDLCSSACCQVNRPGTVASTNQATAATSGLMLIRNNAVFRSEYSAQNNCLVGELSCTNVDLSCGNGFVGSPNANWPCLQDDVGLNRSCFGHGRGMSQWGNHYWTQANPARNWKWQLDHYYNASGTGSGLRNSFISQVLVIDEVRLLPAEAGPGSRISLELDVRNLAAEIHEHVLIGASLRQPPGPFINDPDNDQPVTLPPGNSTVSRQFTIPTDAPEGSYTVYASLFIDVDQNQAVSSNDLAQHLVTLPDALWLDDEIFADNFEEIVAP
jgi:hypothetical protein